jgi:hypothetical protein
LAFHEASSLLSRDWGRTRGSTSSRCTGWRCRRCGDAEGFSDGGEAVAFHVVGEETAAPNKDKSAWRNVLQKSPEEFIAVEGPELAADAFPVILHPEHDAGVVDIDDSTLADW